MVNKPLIRPYLGGGTLGGVGWPAIISLTEIQLIQIFPNMTQLSSTENMKTYSGYILNQAAHQTTKHK